MGRTKKIIKWVLIALSVFLILTAWANYAIESSTKGLLSDNISKLPACRTALLLGTSDNSIEIYNEPADMKKDLVKLGVPDSVIYPDYAGFRTFDSVVRAKEVFGQDSLIMVSQAFHNQRAVYIARQFGVVAYGYNAQDVNAYTGFKTSVREFFARLKVFIDIYTNAKPKFLGEKIKVGK